VKTSRVYVRVCHNSLHTEVDVSFAFNWPLCKFCLKESYFNFVGKAFWIKTLPDLIVGEDKTHTIVSYMDMVTELCIIPL
jgi:hypothetical protein